MKTLKASTSQFSFARYNDTPSHRTVSLPPPPVSSSSEALPKNEVWTQTVAPPTPPSSPQAPHRSSALSPSPPLQFSDDYVTPEERARLCAEDMRRVGMREPRAAWYPTQTALFENLTPSRTTAVKSSSSSAQPKPFSARVFNGFAAQGDLPHCHACSTHRDRASCGCDHFCAESGCLGDRRGESH